MNTNVQTINYTWVKKRFVAYYLFLLVIVGISYYHVVVLALFVVGIIVHTLWTVLIDVPCRAAAPTCNRFLLMILPSIILLTNRKQCNHYEQDRFVNACKRATTQDDWFLNRNRLWGFTLCLQTIQFICVVKLVSPYYHVFANAVSFRLSCVAINRLLNYLFLLQLLFDLTVYKNWLYRYYYMSILMTWFFLVDWNISN